MTAIAADPTIRRQVMAAAREVLARDPDAAIETIANRAGVSRATFYRHFHSRAALLDSVAHEPRPSARSRILAAASEMLVRTSLAELSMDELARAADVSRGTLYRVFPGKAALLHGLIEAFSPFEAVRTIVAGHRDDPPEVVLPLVAREIAGAAGERLGLLRAMFNEASGGSPTALSGMRPIFASTLALLAEYLAAQMAAGRVRRMHPLLALQFFMGPIFFHLMTRPTVEGLAPLPISIGAAVDELVAVGLAGLRP
ncbi:MAG: TetR family transcriptional regulator [Chloroflexi bacterium]|nr:TetR family transcriptional regulator [Chloroflexota bacterium]